MEACCVDSLVSSQAPPSGTDGRLIQRSFWRAFRRNAEGDVDESLIPSSLLAWYEGSDDEEDTVDEVDSDVEED